MTVRGTRNLDDGSLRMTLIGEWFVLDHLKLFAIGSLDRGSDQSEFGNIIGYDAWLGMMFIF